MNTSDLSIFQDVARAGSFSAVARSRQIDPSNISRAISGLEAALGIRLFERTTRRMTLTEAGARYLEGVAPILAELERVTAAARDSKPKPDGTLRLTASVSFGQERIVPLLPRFRALYPDLRLECSFTDTNLDLISDRIDLAIRLGPDVSGDVIRTKLMDTSYHLVASPDYLHTAPPLEKPADLALHRCVLFPLPEFTNSWVFEDPSGAQTRQDVQGDLVVSPAAALRDACRAGAGPALLADWLIKDDIAQGRLQKCLPSYRVTATRFDTAAWLVYPSRSFLPQKVRVAIDFFKIAFRHA